MQTLLRAALIAGATTLASWLLSRWLEGQRSRGGPKRPVETWENEGGALAPQPGLIETSQVPR